MALPKLEVQELIRDARAAVREALDRSHLAKAWELLQERDANGNTKGTLPYTDEALVELAAAHKRDPDDVGVVHHLAIAHHARAWDLELQGDPNAGREWERALGYWRTVVASGEFWNGLKTKLLSCEPDAEPALLDDVRRNLLENLLDIHVDFIRHYCESESPERATAHVEIVRRARIPPAVKKRLIEKVFHAMTGSVPEARATRAYDSALTTVERFLALFPDYLSALRIYAEVCKDWVSGMSHQDDWDDIMRASERAEPYARRLAEHPELGDAPLAQTALEELAFAFGRRGHDKGGRYFAASESRPLPFAARDAARVAFEFSMKWGRLGHLYSPADSPLKSALADSLLVHAITLHEEVSEVMKADTNSRTKFDAAISLYRRAVAELEEAVSCKLDDEEFNNSLTNTLEAFRDNLSELESQKNRLDLFGYPGGML